MNLEAMIGRDWRWTSSEILSELRDALGINYLVKTDMHFEAFIERLWRFIWGPFSRNLAGHN